MKRKVWDLTVLDNPNRAIGGENDDFFTTDTEAFLVFNLSDENFNPTEAMLTLVNTTDRSVVSEEVVVTDGTIKWEMREEIIEHAGNWQAQLIYKQMKGGVEEKYTSQIVTFNVLGHLLDTREAGIVAIENWNNFVKDAEDLFADWADLEDLRQTNEEQRQANYQELLDTGVLQTNINTKLEALEEEYAPKLTEVTTQLAQTRNQMILTPDHFDGTDGQKIQQALDHAISEGEHFISLNRTYDLTGESVFMPTEDFWGRVVFRGGKIIKNDEGFMFDRTGFTKISHAPQFDGTLFESTVDGVYVFNGEGLLRFEMNSCKFTRVGLVHTTSYIQTLRLHQCETEILGCHFIHANNGYDIEISHHRGEQSSTEYQFLKMVTNTPNGISYYGLRILSSLIEGYTRTHAIEIGSGYGLSIKDNYFEKNMGSIRIIKGDGTARIQGIIEGNVFADNLDAYDVFVDTSLFAQRLTLKKNTVTNSDRSGGKYLVNRVLGTKNDMETNGLATLDNVSFYPENLEAIEENTSYAVTVGDLPDGGVVFEIPLQQGTGFANYNELQYLVNIKGQYGSSTIYRGHLTGILTVDIHQEDGIQAVLNFDVLSTRNTNGGTSGNLHAEPVFDYYFKETGTKQAAYNSSNNIVCIEMPNFVNQRHTTCTFKGLDSLMQQQNVFS